MKTSYSLLHGVCFNLLLACASSFGQQVYCEDIIFGPVQFRQVLNSVDEIVMSSKCKDSLIEVTRWFPDGSAAGLAALSRYHHFEVPYEVWKVRMPQVAKDPTSKAIRIRIGNRTFARFRSATQTADIASVLPSKPGSIAIEIPSGLKVFEVTNNVPKEGNQAIFIAFTASAKISVSELEAVALPFLKRGVDVRFSVREDDLTNGLVGASLYTPFSFSMIPDSLEEYRSRWSLSYDKSANKRELKP